mmetsp:Transcript_6526/g.12001  ORF Transcript_6526/g.12001 Transcript_6526/m.12001 type:complete len:460 (-) Transcript_6526:197-1576(-)|eukprot:CAMPEP_0197540700 /NCGR_PEP_ID=MMETSP1318-20131121/66738_1 /TAXON_ID=552666 /ORGANISM="Partenskyella glossopodia, Strain RCC365" /LENGTH=459 /DNA_ID=CAMNT_0043099783 /DNA_START=141 /DNA_END=1520 /DNA_ORIENTATION=+
MLMEEDNDLKSGLISNREDEEREILFDLDKTHAIVISGFCPQKGDLNGEYECTKDWIGQRPVYKKVNADMYIWFKNGWCVGPHAHLGSTIAMAHNEHMGKRLWLSESEWKLKIGGSVQSEPNVKVAPKLDVLVIGANGHNAILNGRYELRQDLLLLPAFARSKYMNRPVYKKPNSPHCIWCCDLGWCIGLESDLGSKKCYAASDEMGMVPWLVDTTWKVVRAGAQPFWAEDPGIKLVPYSDLRVMGCSGPQNGWNGEYVLRQDVLKLPYFSKTKFHNRPVFQKKNGNSSGNQCMWFCELGWCIGREKDKGTTKCGVYNQDDSTVPWMCTSPWKIVDGGKWVKDDHIVVVPEGRTKNEERVDIADADMQDPSHYNNGNLTLLERDSKTGKVPEAMVDELSEVLMKEIAEAEKKLSDPTGDLDPMSMLRSIPIFGRIVNCALPKGSKPSIHTFEPGWFQPE